MKNYFKAPEKFIKKTRNNRVMYTTEFRQIKNLVTDDGVIFYGMSLIVDAAPLKLEIVVTNTFGQEVSCQRIFYDDPWCKYSPKLAPSFRDVLLDALNGGVDEILVPRRDTPALKLFSLVSELLKSSKVRMTLV